MADDFNSLMRLLLYHSQIYGLSPIRQTWRKGRKSFQPFWPGFIYSSVLCGGLFCCLVLSAFLISEIEWRTSILTLHSYFRTLLAPVVVFMIFASSMLSSLGLCQVLNRFSDIDLEFQKHVAKISYKRIKLWTMCFLLAVYAIFISNVMSEDRMFFVELRKNLNSLKRSATDRVVPFYIDWCTFDAVTLIVLVKITAPFYLIQKMLFQINAKFKKEFFNKEKIKGDLNEMKIFILTRGKRTNMKLEMRDKLLLIRELHVQLVIMAEDLNKIFATRILLIISSQVILICFCCFIFVTAWLKSIQDLSFWAILTFWLCMRLFVTCGLILPFCLIVNEVSSLSFFETYYWDFV